MAMLIAEPKWNGPNAGNKDKHKTNKVKYGKDLPKILTRVAEEAGQEEGSVLMRYTYVALMLNKSCACFTTSIYY